MAVTKLVAKSQPECKEIRWTTPVGFPVAMSKHHTGSRQIKTYLDGKIFRPRLMFDTDELNPAKMATTVAPSFVHALDAAHLVETIDRSSSQGVDSFAVVHDSFGVHACDVPKFGYTIRQAFIDIYKDGTVLENFLKEAKVLIKEQLHDEIPPLPPMGKLDINGVMDNPFFFS